MNKFVLFFLIFFLTLPGGNIFSQKIYREGYLVKKTGETLTGLIEYSINQGVPSKCKFKRFEIAVAVNYSPDEISAFGYRKGNRYESKELNKLNSFYEAIIIGKISLYQKGSKFFIEKDNSGIIEVKNSSIIYQVSGQKTEYKTLSEFISFLTESKPGAISPGLSTKELIPVILAYNRETGKPYNSYNRTIAETQLRQLTFRSGTNKNRFGIVSGLNLYKLNLKPLTPNYLPDPEVEAGIIYGFTYERIISRKTENLSLRLDLLCLNQDFYCYDERFSSGNMFVSRSDAFFNFTALKFPLVFQYSLPVGRTMPYLSFGVACQVLLNNSYIRIEESESKEHIINTLEFRNMNFKPKEFSIVGGAGVKTRIFSNMYLHFQGNVEIGSGIFNQGRKMTRGYNQMSFQTTFLTGISF